MKDRTLIPGKNPIAPGQPSYCGPWPGMTPTPRSGSSRGAPASSGLATSERHARPATGGVTSPPCPALGQGSATVTCTFATEAGPKDHIEKGIESVRTLSP